MYIKSLIVAVSCLSLAGNLTAQTVKKPVKPAVTKLIPVADTISFESIPDSVTATSASMAAFLKNNHSNQSAILKSLYGWMGNNIRYDIENAFQPNYYKDSADAIDKTLKTRMATGRGYVTLFTDVCRCTGIPSWIVDGYPITAGKAGNASHTWVAVFTDNKWQLVDPTWGAGYVSDNKFVQHLNWEYFLVSPAAFIKTHAPFDAMFQFLDHPLKPEEIQDEKWTAGSSRPVFNYQDTLAAYSRMSEKERAQNAAARLVHYGITNQMIGNELAYLNRTVYTIMYNERVVARNEMLHKSNQAGNLYDSLVTAYNQYVVFRNNQFTPAKPDQEIREWIDGMATGLDHVDKLLQSMVGAEEPNDIKWYAKMKILTAQLRQMVEKEQTFVTVYIKTRKSYRKDLFYIKY